jgi:Fe-S cluster biogenesis protein NfuA
MSEAQESGIGAAAEFERRVAAALEAIRPILQADGGDIELLSVVGRDAHVRLRGACHGCPSAALTLQAAVQRLLREEVPGFGEVIDETPEDGYGWRFDLWEAP